MACAPSTKATCPRLGWKAGYPLRVLLPVGSADGTGPSTSTASGPLPWNRGPEAQDACSLGHWLGSSRTWLLKGSGAMVALSTPKDVYALTSVSGLQNWESCFKPPDLWSLHVFTPGHSRVGDRGSPVPSWASRGGGTGPSCQYHLVWKELGHLASLLPLALTVPRERGQLSQKPGWGSWGHTHIHCGRSGRVCSACTSDTTLETVAQGTACVHDYLQQRGAILLMV